MPMDDEDGLSFGYRTPQDVTDALKRKFRQVGAAADGRGLEDREATLGPFVYHAEGLTFAFVEHEGVDKGVISTAFFRACLAGRHRKPY